jgi:hypothetical protein
MKPEVLSVQQLRDEHGLRRSIMIRTSELKLNPRPQNFTANFTALSAEQAPNRHLCSG